MESKEGYRETDGKRKERQAVVSRRDRGKVAGGIKR